jgi:hypothetical protein
MDPEDRVLGPARRLGLFLAWQGVGGGYLIGLALSVGLISFPGLPDPGRHPFSLPGRSRGGVFADVKVNAPVEKPSHRKRLTFEGISKFSGPSICRNADRPMRTRNYTKLPKFFLVHPSPWPSPTRGEGNRRKEPLAITVKTPFGQRRGATTRSYRNHAGRNAGWG